MSILGNRVLRKEDPRFLRGEGRYVENLPVEGAASVTFVRSLLAHARIGEVDTSAAEELPNVQVLTAADLDLPPFGPPPFPGLNQAMGRPLIAKDVVRFVGDIVAIVISDDRRSGADAAELVFIDYDPLTAVVTPEDAAKDEVLLFPEAGTNVAAFPGSPDHDEKLFDGCDVVVSGTLHSQRMAPCPLEPRSCAAEFGPDGRLTAWLSTQTPHQDRMVLAGMLGLEPEQVRVIAPDVGGGFGAKMLNAEELLLAWVARKVGRPVRWTETRSESMVALPHGRAQRLDFTIGGTKDGKVLAYRLDSLQDAGAYPALGAFLPNLTALMASGVYAIPRIEFEGRSVVTNTTPISAFRGAGRPRRRRRSSAPWTRSRPSSGSIPPRSGAGTSSRTTRSRTRPSLMPPTTPATTGRARARASLGRYDELRAEQQRRRDEGGAKQLGIGISCYVEITNGVAETEFGEVEITPDGGAIVRTGSFSHGQGHETTFAMIAAERLGLPLEKVTVHKGDTDEIARGTGTYGSKSTQIGGAAARLAADDVVEQAKQLVADYLEASPADIVLDQGTRPPPRGGRSLDRDLLGRSRLARLGRRAARRAEGGARVPGRPDIPLRRSHRRRRGRHGDRARRAASARRRRRRRHADQPAVAEGQVHGGIATGVAQALYEQVLYDEDGNPLTGTFVGYAFPSAADLPSWEAVEMETPTPMNALGAKGIGESGTIGATPAVQNAVVDALAPFGVRHVDLPANGENVWRALQEAKA